MFVLSQSPVLFSITIDLNIFMKRFLRKFACCSRIYYLFIICMIITFLQRFSICFWLLTFKQFNLKKKKSRFHRQCSAVRYTNSLNATHHRYVSLVNYVNRLNRAHNTRDKFLFVLHAKSLEGPEMAFLKKTSLNATTRP